MTGPDRHDLLWAIVGALGFLVLLQGYELVFGERVAVVVKVGVAIGVGILSATLTRAAARLLVARNGRA